MMKIGGIVQARMSSRRLPGKMLRDVAGRPLLGYVRERLMQVKGWEGFVLCTSTESSDDPIAHYCQQHGINCYRGDLENVAQRFLGALDQYDYDVFVRVNGDSPLLDQAIIEEGIGLFQGGDFDLVTNVMPRSFPPGQSVEVVNTQTYRHAYALMTLPEEFEHVTKHFYLHPESYRIYNFSAPMDCSGVHMAVDTQEDLDRFAMMLSRMDRPHWQYSLTRMLSLWQEGSAANDHA